MIPINGELNNWFIQFPTSESVADFLAVFLDKTSRAPNENILAEYLKYHFCFLSLFQSFLKVFFCKLIQIDLFGVFS